MSRFIKLGVCLLICGLMAVVLSPVSLAQATGTIEGAIANGTAGGPAVAGGMEVTLRAARGEEALEPRQALADDQGRFRFEGLDTDPTIEYAPEVVYQDVTYGAAEALSFASGQTALQTAVTLYETTAETSAIGVDSVHLIVESFGQVLRVSEVHLIGNSGDRTVVGKVQAGQDRPTTLFFATPAGATGLSFPEGESADRYVETADGMWDTAPVRPGSGTSVVRFSYHLVVSGTTVPLERAFSYPVKTLNILVAQPGLSLSSAQLESQGPVTFQEQQYEVFYAQELGPETPLSLLFTVTGEAATGATPSAPVAEQTATPALLGQQGLLRWLGVVLVVLAAAGAIAYALAAKPAERSRAAWAQRGESKELLSRLAALDAAWEAGEIEDSDYRQQRSELVAAIKSV